MRRTKQMEKRKREVKRIIKKEDMMDTKIVDALNILTNSLKALSDENRLNIFFHLKFYPSSFTELLILFNLRSKSDLSYHLKILNNNLLIDKKHADKTDNITHYELSEYGELIFEYLYPLIKELQLSSEDENLLLNE